MSGRLSLPSFPDPVNEVAARLVAGGVAVVAAKPWSPAGTGWPCPSPTASWPGP